MATSKGCDRVDQDIKIGLGNVAGSVNMAGP